MKVGSNYRLRRISKPFISAKMERNLRRTIMTWNGSKFPKRSSGCCWMFWHQKRSLIFRSKQRRQLDHFRDTTTYSQVFDCLSASPSQSKSLSIIRSFFSNRRLTAWAEKWSSTPEANWPEEEPRTSWEVNWATLDGVKEVISHEAQEFCLHNGMQRKMMMMMTTGQKRGAVLYGFLKCLQEFQLAISSKNGENSWRSQSANKTAFLFSNIHWPLMILRSPSSWRKLMLCEPSS